MGSEEIDETPTGVLASGGDRGRLGQRNHQLVDGASPGKGMCFCTLGGRGRQTSHRRPHLRLQKRVRDTPSRCLARSGWAALSQLRCDQRAEFQHPAPHGLIGDVEPTLGEQFLHVSVVQREAEIKPHRMLNDLGRKAMTAIRKRSHGS